MSTLIIHGMKHLKKAKAKLAHRQAKFDRRTDKKLTGFKRPGSMNLKKGIS